jgi:sterol desaturase/sphingolipid hydroxylase (fatty acid hydroxylase superfamily)
MLDPETDAGWLRPAAAAAGLLLLWHLESLQKHPPRPRNPSRLLHAGRNLTLGAINALVLRAVAAGFTAAATEWLTTTQTGLLYALTLPSAIRPVLALLLLDFWTWYWHRACHRVPFLWRFHRVHHSDPAMDVTTAFRFHPVELLLSTIIRLPVLALIGATVTELLVYETLLLASSQFQHAALSGGRWDQALRRVLVTPSVHRIHHSPERPLTNSNYASLLNCWDRLFGTWRTPAEEDLPPNAAAPECGLYGLHEEHWQTISGLILNTAMHPDLQPQTHRLSDADSPCRPDRSLQPDQD